MTQSNRLAKFVNATQKLPQSVRSTLWSKAFGRVVPMVGTAQIRYLEVEPSRVVVRIENTRKMQNHIKGVHAAATALLAETATGFLTALNVPDDRIVLIKSLHVDYLKVTQSPYLTATATLTQAQQQFILDNSKGELMIPVTVMDDNGNSPVECQMLWAWVAKRKK